jgi:L-glutamine---4-(methylsulfanyl)-2-oxobutanoate aminotransferase
VKRRRRHPAGPDYHRPVRPRPQRLERLPEQYFSRLLARVSAAALADGEPLVDLGRGNPDLSPPAHVVERLAAAAAESTPRMHGYAPFLGLPELKQAVAGRYAREYGVELDAEREVAIVPGTKTAIVELALALAERGDTILLPDPGYPDYHSGAALAGARVEPLPLDRAAGWLPDFGSLPRNRVAAVYLNFPSNPCAVCAPPDLFAEAVRFGEQTGAAIVHDFAYGDLVFDGRTPASFLATPGAKEVGVELFSMSKSYGMAGWRLGFVVGNAELVARADLLSDHARAGIFRPAQEAAIAALTGPQETVAARRALYQARRDRVVARLPGAHSDGTFYVWVELPAGVTPETLLAEQRVAVAPGEGFGSRGAGFARLSLAAGDEALDLGLDRLAPVFATAYAARR